MKLDLISLGQERKKHTKQQYGKNCHSGGVGLNIELQYLLTVIVIRISPEPICYLLIIYLNVCLSFSSHKEQMNYKPIKKDDS